MEAGEPDLKFAGFSLWVLGRQFPDHNDYGDGNWLNVWVDIVTPLYLFSRSDHFESHDCLMQKDSFALAGKKESQMIAKER
jgi:hypothetical protein